MSILYLAHGERPVARRRGRFLHPAGARRTLGATALALAAACAAAADPPLAADGQLNPQRLVAAVLARNPGIAALRAAARAAAARVEPAGVLKDPQLSYALAPQTIGGTGLGQRITLSQAIPWPGTLALRETAARGDAKAAEADLADLRLEIIAAIKAAFAEWYYVHRALSVNKANQALLTELRQVAETRYATGRATQQDALQAEVQLARLQEQALALKRQRRSIRAQINALLYRPADQPLPPPAAVRAQPAPVPPFNALQQIAIETHPELKRLQAKLAAQRTKVGLAKKNFYPEFQLSTGYNSLWEAQDKRWSVGVSISIPWNRSKYRSLLDAAQADAMQARWHLADRRAKLLSQLAAARAAVVAANKTIALYQERLVPLARANLDAALANYRAGAGAFLEVINALVNKLTTALRLARARANYLRRRAELERRAGGDLPA